MENDTITAIATGLKPAGISIIRISGPKTFDVADRVFRSKSGISVKEMKSYTVSYGHIVNYLTEDAHIAGIETAGETKIAKDSDTIRGVVTASETDTLKASENARTFNTLHKFEIIDEVLLIKMAAPSTYTREDVVERDCHGGIAVTKAVLEAVIKAGARLAEPGEFTKRAFLNGRIDLSQAEAVSDLIASTSNLSVKNSVRQLGGELRKRISSLRDKLITDTAYIEAALDYPEHIELNGFSDTLSVTIADSEKEIGRLLDSFESGRIIKNGINTVIIGQPNVGKSSLMNRLLGTERAIVTDIVGTTRDTLSESALINGILLNIIDTAGIRETSDVIEKIGVEKAIDAAENADLLLFLKDATDRCLSEKEAQILKDICSRPDKDGTMNRTKTIFVINKTDIENNYDLEEFGSEISEKCNISTYAYERKKDLIPEKTPVVCISAKTGSGMDQLGECIEKMFLGGSINDNDDIYITNIRHKELLSSAINSLKNVSSAIEQGLSEDFYTIDLMDAVTSLGMITGENVEDELANKIFSEFCMGK